MPYYVLDENNNRQEAYTKEEILSVLAQAIADGSLAGVSADAGFITKLKCCVSGTTVKEAFVTQAKYNELLASGSLESNTYYNIIDDTILDDINETLKEHSASIEELTDKQQRMQFINTTDLPSAVTLYDGEYKKVDLSSLMYANKSYKDVIGFSGCLEINGIAGGFFSSFYNYYALEAASFLVTVKIDDTIYYVKLTMGINSQKQLYLQYITELNGKTISSVKISSIYIYYK